jgi:hypothetical protein
MVTILGFIAAFVVVALTSWAVMTEKQRLQFANFLSTWILAGLHGATALLNDAEPYLEPIVKAFVGAFNNYAGPIAQDIRAPVATVAKNILATSAAGLTSSGLSTPDNAMQMAGDAMADAFGGGIASFGVTAAFEAALPEKLNVLNGVGPMIASLSGFDEVTAAIRDPLYHNAFGKSADYYFRSLFKPELPDEQDAVRWHSRGLLTDAQLRVVFKYSGLKQEYEAAFVQSAYRPVSPFVLAAGYINADLPTKQLYDAMQFMGLRPADQDLMYHTIEVRSLQQTRNALVTVALSAYGKGVVSDAELQQILTDAGYGAKASALVKQHALINRRVTLASESESFVVPEVTAGLLTPAEGAQALEAAGVQPWQADLKMTLAQTKQALVAARKAAAAQHQLQIKRQREETRVAIASYETGAVDDAGLTAALITIGLDPVLVGSIVAVEAAKRAGRLKLVYGQLLAPKDAKVLTEQVAALEGQFKKQLIDEASLRAQLAGLKVDGPEIEALVARWAAARTAATKTGYVLPV